MERIAAAFFLGLVSVNSYAYNSFHPAEGNSLPGNAIESTAVAPVYDNGPLARNGYRGGIQASNNSTYIKCSDRIDSDPANPAASWVWAVHPQQPDRYAIVRGYWRDSNATANMFYTSASAQELKAICEFTLKQAGIVGETLVPYAGDSPFPYYYPFWSQGGNLPAATLDGIRLDRLVVFGDSLSDTINAYNASYGALPKTSAWLHGRFSNGPLWHEYWAQTLNIPSYTWASGNMESGISSPFSGFTEQLNNFKNYLSYTQQYDIKKTLFTVMFGVDDFISNGKTPDEIVNNYRSGLNQLAQMGAAQVVIFRLPDLSDAPALRSWRAANKKALKEKTALFNAKLEALEQELTHSWTNTQFIVLSLDKAFNDLLTHADKLGYVNTADSCLNLSDDGFSYLYHYQPRPACKSSGGSFIFWDNLHPSAHAHSDLSKMLYLELRLKLQQVAHRERQA